ncbi:NADPH-dependent 7-cyano-7-deazaguanine reductase [Cellvibrio zantedeschiae]|uniref:NADPH-dependent 7-cyano-7-deazaguanine reductase n=1 Tax=Cellvibrio zantedeschiae TaxID=1237077 RepID=A0ABQ3AUW2_9GAMM|nr:NADPH-dependent 7-cyano-7-deazaguanine reductase QueF [Cellvibrio zantedeschiae]GGY68092.1 NADPH-dependent 7-cyano-7-deazaguanine reductase [Cellvibrio zantedeschiae]
MAHSIDSSPLGQKSSYVSSYDASLLFPIARAESRKALGLSEQLPFYGHDIWTGYELSWLNLKGKPEVAVAEFVIPFDSPCIIESKSFKLYLNSLNQTKFSGFDEVKTLLLKDLSAAAGADVSVSLHPLRDSNLLIDFTFNATCIDGLDIEVDAYHPQPDILTADASCSVKETLCSHLLKSNCPVTGQPDWASVIVEYEGAKINHENLLRYVVSFREHQDFHEHCVERIFTDILAQCKPEFLSVYARYTRRGGLDINPFRSSEKGAKPAVGRLLRQ